MSVPKSVYPVVIIAAILLGGCATLPSPPVLLATSVPIKSTDGAASIKDGRVRFRAIFCSLLQSEGLATTEDTTCDRWLWRLPDEPQAANIQASITPAPEKLAIFLVTGAFSECVGEEARPLAAGAARLRTAGAHVETIVVSGRSGSDHNALQIAAALTRAPLHDATAIILIGFSKGALDILHYLVNFPAAARQVDAVVSLASPVYGSPLANKTDAPYSALLANLPHPACPPGDGEILSTLRTDTATQWLVENRLPVHVRYYSLAAFTTREHVARGLVPTWKYLNQTDPRNDGQVIATDAVIPGATLLGYANADHWGIATTIESAHPFLGARPDPTLFPLETLFDAIVQFVADDLAVSGNSSAGREIPTGANVTAAKQRLAAP